MKLFYFDMSGRGEVTRIMLKSKQHEFEDVRFTREEWNSTYKKLSPTGQCPFMQLDDGTYLAQSKALEGYVAGLTGYLPEDPVQAAKMWMLYENIAEMYASIQPTFQMKEEERVAARKVLMAEGGTAHRMLKAIETFLEARSTEFAVSDKPSLFEISCFQAVTWMISGKLDGIDASSLASFPKVLELRAKVAAVPDIAAVAEMNAYVRFKPDEDESMPSKSVTATLRPPRPIVDLASPRPGFSLQDKRLNSPRTLRRISYTDSDLIGGRNGQFKVDGLRASREDFVITNAREQKLQCSQWQLSGSSAGGAIPCVIYCHCNSGSRMDAAEAIGHLLPMGIRVFALDFTGSGLSDGEYVTLGANESDDLECLVNFIRQGGHTSLIALWGRSMGAVTALLYSVRDPTVAAIVMDSPFSKLTDLMWEILEERKIPLRKYLGGTALRLMRRSVKRRAGFDIQALAPIDHVGACFTPALFAHATGDNFVQCSHTERLHAAYAGDKHLVTFDGDHNSARPRVFYHEVIGFLTRALQLDAVQIAARQEGHLPRGAAVAADEVDLSMPPDTGHTRQPWATLQYEPEDAESLRAALSHLPASLVDADPATEDVDLELQAVLALSLQEQHALTGPGGPLQDFVEAREAGHELAGSRPGPGRSAAPGGGEGAGLGEPHTRGGGAGSAPPSAPTSTRGAHAHAQPVTAEEEEIMLRAAIEASLKEAGAGVAPPSGLSCEASPAAATAAGIPSTGGDLISVTDLPEGATVHVDATSASAAQAAAQ